jgi:hypothetical protein
MYFFPAPGGRPKPFRRSKTHKPAKVATGEPPFRLKAGHFAVTRSFDGSRRGARVWLRHGVIN